MRVAIAMLVLVGCESTPVPLAKVEAPAAPPSYFVVDAATAGSIRGKVSFVGKKPAGTPVNMTQDVDCNRMNLAALKKNEELVVDAKGGLSEVFVYLKTGLEGKNFAPAAQPVTIDQKGCWFGPRILGVQTAQGLRVVNSDPVTHNIHPQAKVNREWNQSQGPGDEPVTRKFARAELMIPVKCNIHKWMHATIAVVEHPYFAVSAGDGSFTIGNVPPGEYTIAAWQEKLGWQEQKLTIAPSTPVTVNFKFQGD